MNVQAFGNDEHASRHAWMEMAFLPSAQIVQQNKIVRLTNNGPLEESTSSGPEQRMQHIPTITVVHNLTNMLNHIKCHCKHSIINHQTDRLNAVKYASKSQ
jgi:hypothetical protein